MWPVFMLGARFPIATEICRVCGAVPLVGVTESQGESLDAVKVRVPAPVLEILTEAGKGLEALPCVAENERAVSEIEREGMPEGVELAAPPQPAGTVLMITNRRMNAKRFIGRDTRKRLSRYEFKNPLRSLASSS